MSTSGNKAFMSSIVVMDFTTLFRVVTIMNIHPLDPQIHQHTASTLQSQFSRVPCPLILLLRTVHMILNILYGWRAICRLIPQYLLQLRHMIIIIQPLRTFQKTELWRSRRVFPIDSALIPGAGVIIFQVKYVIHLWIWKLMVMSLKETRLTEYLILCPWCRHWSISVQDTLFQKKELCHRETWFNVEGPWGRLSWGQVHSTQ